MPYFISSESHISFYFFTSLKSKVRMCLGTGVWQSPSVLWQSPPSSHCPSMSTHQRLGKTSQQIAPLQRAHNQMFVVVNAQQYSWLKAGSSHLVAKPGKKLCTNGFSLSYRFFRKSWVTSIFKGTYIHKHGHQSHKLKVIQNWTLDMTKMPFFL